jgi:hypothetical protein
MNKRVSKYTANLALTQYVAVQQRELTGRG